LQTSVGGTYETQRLRTFSYRNYGLVPAVDACREACSGTDSITEFHDQSHYINEQIIALDEKLSLSAGLRTDRSSANGDRLKYYTFPKFSASYRLTQPLSRFTSSLDEIKLRASFGKSGNRPLSPFTRDITIAAAASWQPGFIDGVGRTQQPASSRVMNEQGTSGRDAVSRARISQTTH
jgi:outer membrane receptor protein involved in Fe transport